MKRTQILLLAIGVTIFASTASPVSLQAEERIACASDVPAVRKGHWYYRIIDGRKCWYDGKPMLPKTQLYWPDASGAGGLREPAEPSQQQAASSAQSAGKPYTDGRSVSTPAATDVSLTTPPAAAEPTAPQSATAQSPGWMQPSAHEISFESRWLGLYSKN